MTAQERIALFRAWTQQAKEKPELYKLIRLHPDVGTFGIATKEDDEWKIRFFLPPWKKEKEC